MQKGFIVGNFLPAYSSAFTFRDTVPTSPGLESNRLRERFIERSERFSTRKRRYGQGLMVSLALALLVVTGIFRIPMSSSSDLSFTIAEQELVQIEEITPTQQKVLPPPPPKPPVPVAVADDTILEDDDLSLDASLDIDEAIENTPPPPPPAGEPEESEPAFFVAVEQMPTMIGGLQQLSSDLKYPELARKTGLEGTVVVQIIVDEDGKPRDAEVLRPVAEVLDKAAVEAVLKQRFEPGRQRSRPVPVRIAIPVRFYLK